MIEFTLPGKAMPAVRMTQRSMYAKKNAKRYRNYKNHVAWVARQHMQGRPIEGSVGVRITHYIHGNRADIDNLFKGVTDSLNKIVYKDDRQIKEMNRKYYPVKNQNNVRKWRSTR